MQKFYLNCLHSTSGLVPRSFSLERQPTSTHYGYWEDRVAIPQGEIDVYPQTPTPFGLLICPDYRVMPWVVCIARFTSKGYIPVYLRMAHQVYADILRQQGILPTIFPLWEVQIDQEKP